MLGQRLAESWVDSMVESWVELMVQRLVGWMVEMLVGWMAEQLALLKALTKVDHWATMLVEKLVQRWGYQVQQKASKLVRKS